MLGKELLFLYDVKFFEYKNAVYSRYGITDDLMKRYAFYFEEVHYLGRKEKIIVDDNILNKSIKLNNIKVHLVDFSSINSFQFIKENIKESDFCVLRLPSIIGEIGWFYCKKFNKPCLVEVVGNAFEALWYYSLKGKLVSFPLDILMKYIVKRSAYVAYITRYYLQNCYKTYGILYSGVANVSLDNIIPNSVITKRIECFYKKEEFVLGLIGALNVKYKGHKIAIRALAIVKKKIPYMSLRFLGQGDNTELLRYAQKMGVENSVYFDGVLSAGKAVNAWLDGIDIYLQPSYTEGHGRSVIEAQSRGCVVLTSDVGGLRDSVSSSFRFNKGDSNGLAKLIFRVIDNNNLAKQNILEGIQNANCYKSDLIEEKRNRAIYDTFYNIK